MAKPWEKAAGVKSGAQTVNPMVAQGRALQQEAWKAVAPKAAGGREAGNIDLSARPNVKNADGSISTVRSMSFGTPQGEVLVPTVSEDGRIMEDQEAIDTYRKTGRHLGIFDTLDNATAYANALHDAQERFYAKRDYSIGQPKSRGTKPWEKAAAVRNAPFVPERDNAPGMAAMIRKDYQGAIPEQPRYFKRPAPVMLPEEQAALDAEKAREAARVKERREAAGAYGVGQDFIITHGDDGQLRPSGPSDVVNYDVGKGVVGLPIQGLEAVKDAGVSLVNLASETYNTVNNAITAPLGVRPAQVPKITTPDNPLIAEGGALQSVTGDLERNLMQFLISRNIVGKMAPGGGIGADIAKDAIALGAGFDADTPRLSETVNEFVQKSGSPQIAKDYIGWLAQRDPSNPLLERMKNMIEDMTISGPLVAPQAVVRGTEVVGNALKPIAQTPTNAGGAGVREALDDPYRVPGAQAATGGNPPPQAAAAAQAPVTSVPVTRTPQQPPANALAAPAPQQAAGQAIPPPSNAVDEFNALPMKTRESLIRAMTESGMSRPQINAAIQSLGNIPPGRRSMFATELLRKLGSQFPNLETNLTAMGRKWANETPAARQMFGGRDSAREAMDNEIRTQINSEGQAITDVVERNFGEGVVPTGNALDTELAERSAAYDRVLSTRRKATGRLRNEQKKQAVLNARKDLTYYLTLDEVKRTIPDWVKKKIMRQASDDLRRLNFSNEELATILKGDGAVLAPLFDGNRPLVWSDDLWNHLANQYPTQAAHSLQSAFRSAADDAWKRGTQADIEDAKMLQRMRGESGEGGLLDMLERAVPEYKETRVKFGDTKDAEEAFGLLDRFKAAVANEGDLGEVIKGLEALPARHRAIAENQITSLIRQELSRKIDSAKLSQLDDAARETTPNLSIISRADFLKALEDVFGERGRELADAIRLSRSMTDTLTGIHPKYNSRSVLNNEDVKNAGELYEHPASKDVNVFDRSAQTVAGIGVGAAALPGGQAAAIGMLGYAGLKSLYNAWKKGKRLTNAEKTALVDFLFRSRDGSAPARAGNGPPTGRPPRGPSGLGYGANALAGAGAGGGIGYYSSGGDAETTAKGALVGAGFGAGRAVQRARRNANSLIKLPNALASPSPPPVRNGSGPINKAGFGGSSDPSKLSGLERLHKGYPMTSEDALDFRITLQRHQDMSVEDLRKLLRLKHRMPPTEVRAFAEKTYRTAKDELLTRVRSEAATANYATVTQIVAMRQRGVPDQMIARSLGLEDEVLDEFIARWGNPPKSGSSKLLAGFNSGAPEAVGAGAGGAAGYFGAQDANGDGVVDDAELSAQALGGFASGLVASKIIRGGVNAARGGAKPPGGAMDGAMGGSTLELPASNRVFGPGQPDDLGFITAAEYVLATPPARFRDAQKLNADQWRKFFREGGASGESFEFQIEPALKQLADQGYTSDIPKARLEEALARNRGTLDLVDKKQLGEHGFAAHQDSLRRIHESAGNAVGERNRPRQERLLAEAKAKEESVEAKYDEYIAPGKSSNYQQHVLTLPENLGQGYKSHNWNTKNPVGHIRFTNRTSAKGEKVLHVEELQSDLHQEGAKYGYRGENAVTPEQVQKLADAAKQAEARLSEWSRRTDRSGPNDRATSEELLREATAARSRYEDAAVGQRNAPPRAPLENWEEPFIRYALKQGADQGVDVVTFPTGRSLHDALFNEGTEKFYDGRLPRHLEGVAKSLGLRVEQVSMEMPHKDGLGYPVRTLEVPAIRLTPEAKARLSQGVIMDAKDPGRRATPKRPPPAQAGFSFGGGGKRPPNALKDSGMPGPISPRVLEDATKAAGRLSPEARNKLRANAFSDDPAPAMQASGFDPNLFSFAQDARTPPPGKVQNAFARLTGQPTANSLERGLQKSIESVAGQRGRSALRVGNEDVPDLPFGMRMAMGERNATRKEQALARRAYTRSEKADKLDADKVKRVVVAEREARVAQEILDQARLDAFSAEDVGAIVREQMDAIAKAMNREPPSTLGLPTKGQRVSDALDDVVFGAPPKGARARPKAKDATYSASEAEDAAKLLFSKEYARVWDDIVSGRTPVESIKPGSKEHLVLTVAAVGGIGALGVTSALLADRSGPMQEPHYPKPEDPRVHFDWTKQRANRRFVENLQTRFNQIDRRYQLREDGIWSEGGDTDKVIRFWQDTNGFAPDGNLTEDQVALIEAQAIEALRAEPVGGRSGQPTRPAPRNALAQAQ